MDEIIKAECVRQGVNPERFAAHVARLRPDLTADQVASAVATYRNNNCATCGRDVFGQPRIEGPSGRYCRSCATEDLYG